MTLTTILGALLLIIGVPVTLWLIYEVTRPYYECDRCGTQLPPNKPHHCPWDWDDFGAPEGYGRLNER